MTYSVTKLAIYRESVLLPRSRCKHTGMFLQMHSVNDPMLGISAQ